MKVILLKDVENTGERYELKEVKSGFARNFLIPRKLAKPATKQNLKWLSQQKKICAEKANQELEEVQKKVKTVDGREIEIKVKVGDNNQLFESITPQRISEELKKEGFLVKKDQIDLEEPIKELGEFKVRIVFKHKLEAEIKIIIIEEIS